MEEITSIDEVRGEAGSVAEIAFVGVARALSRVVLVDGDVDAMMTN